MTEISNRLLALTSALEALHEAIEAAPNDALDPDLMRDAAWLATVGMEIGYRACSKREPQECEPEEGDRA